MLFPLVVIAVATPVSSSSGSTEPAPATFSFAYDGVAGEVVRGAPGSDDHPVPGTFTDPATGRAAPVLVGSSVIVKGPAPPGTHLVKALMPSLRLNLVAADGLDAAALAERLSARGIDAYPNLAFRQRALSTTIPPDDPRYPDQFYLSEVGIEDAWRISTGSAEVTVLVADNGCDLEHPDLKDKMDPGFDPFENDGDPSYVPNEDGNGHGTSCAGIIAADTDNGVDIAGACPDCRLRCARLLPGNNEPVTVDSDVQTYQFALDQDVDVVSNSWGFVDAIPVPGPLKDAILAVEHDGRHGKGAIVVFASGNDDRIVGDDELLAVDGIIGVGAVDSFGELTQFSNGGSSVDVVAPTGTVTTDISGADGLDPGDVTTKFGGTSSACPVVSGIAGLLVAAFPDKSGAELSQALIDTAKQSTFATPDGDGHDVHYGFGLVQPAEALASLQPAAPADDAAPPGGCGCASAAPGDAAAALVALALWRVGGGKRRALASPPRRRGRL